MSALYPLLAIPAVVFIFWIRSAYVCSCNSKVRIWK